MTEQEKIEAQMQEHFAQLPKVLQNAITSADVDRRLRALSDEHRLHVDQWEKLENHVRFILFGMQEAGDLKEAIEKSVGLSNEVALALANDIAAQIFDPVRKELERELEHPDAVAASVSDVEAARTQTLAQENTVNATPPSPQPSPEGRGGSSSPQTLPDQTDSPQGGEGAPPVPEQPKAERKAVEGDPYREATA